MSEDHRLDASPESTSAPLPEVQPEATPRPRRLPVWAILAICVPLQLALIGFVLVVTIPHLRVTGGPPVMPDRVLGVPRSTDPVLNEATDTIRTGLGRHNPGHKFDAQAYGAVGTGYLVIGLNARIDPAREFRGFQVAGKVQSFGDVTCASSETLTVCVRSGRRGSIELVGAASSSGMDRLAADTARVWTLQPY